MRARGDLLNKYYQGKITLEKVLETLAPGTPPFNRKRSHNPIAYHKYTCGKGYTFYIMEYILDGDYLRFWGYEIDNEDGTKINLGSWYRTIGMGMIVGAKMKRDPNFKSTPALDIPEIGKEWLSTTHDTKRDHLAASYAKKYYKAYEYTQLSLMQNLNIVYQYKGEKLDQQFWRKVNKN